MAVSVGRVLLGDGVKKIIVPIMPTSRDSVGELLAGAVAAQPDIIEWRCDFLASFQENPGNLEEICAVVDYVRQHTDIPLLATCRTRLEGGEVALGDEEYANLLRHLISCGVDAVDVEFFSYPDVWDTVLPVAREANIPVIASHHNFGSTPEELEILNRLATMEEGGADIAKIAVFPHGPADVCTLLSATATAAKYMDIPIISMAMGPYGILSRMTPAVFGSCATFGSAGQVSAPGQVDVAAMRDVITRLEEWTGLP